MIACKVPAAAGSDDTVDGFHIHIGGGFGPDASIARELFPNVKVEDCPRIVLRILKVYLSERTDNRETFLAFVRRTDIDTLKSLVAAEETTE